MTSEQQKSKRSLVCQHPLGFFQVKEKPSKKELEEYYAKKYYQAGKGNYQAHYSSEELRYFEVKNLQKYLIANSHVQKKNQSFLDIGCGEGFMLDHYRRKGWNVFGLDYSSFGCEQMCPECVPFIIVGDIYKNLDNLVTSAKKFDVISMTHVLEHVLDPEELLEIIRKISHHGTVLVITVPNDFSFYQEFMLKEKMIADEFWIAVPDHISYFNHRTLPKICETHEWVMVDMVADFPVDIFLANAHSNYVLDRSKGKQAHAVRVKLENLFHEVSPEKTIDFYRSMAQLGFGRSISGFFKLQ